MENTLGYPNTIDGLVDELIDSVIGHDYSYSYSDDNRYFNAGVKSQKRIQSLIENLIVVHGLDAGKLMEDCINNRSEQYLDGLTHTTIKMWFEKYF